jgi:transposase
MAQAGRRRRFTAEEKQRLVQEAQEPGSSISAVSRRHGIASSQLFKWRRLMEDGALQGLDAEEAVVPESEVKELRHQVRELQRLLGKKTLEAEILKEAIELARSKKLLLRLKSPEGGDSQ